MVAAMDTEDRNTDGHRERCVKALLAAIEASPGMRIGELIAHALYDHRDAGGASLNLDTVWAISDETMGSAMEVYLAEHGGPLP